jgi:hypothetical protein
MRLLQVWDKKVCSMAAASAYTQNEDSKAESMSMITRLQK